MNWLLISYFVVSLNGTWKDEHVNTQMFATEQQCYTASVEISKLHHEIDNEKYAILKQECKKVD